MVFSIILFAHILPILTIVVNALTIFIRHIIGLGARVSLVLSAFVENFAILTGALAAYRLF